MRAFIQIIAGACVMLWGAISHAESIASPIGIEVGKTTCSEATDIFAHTPMIKGDTDESSWSHGKVIELTQVDGFKMAGLEHVAVVCGPSDVTMVVNLVFSKGGMGIPDVVSTAKQLDRKYSLVTKNLPELGDGLARWSASNASIELVYGFQSFDFDLTYWAPGAEAIFKKWHDAQGKEADQKKTNQL